MSFFLFLLSVLIATIFYLRISKKIAGLELELSEDLKSEIISLIAEFNQSAERNITLIEDKVNIAKSVASEIASQVAYMEKLKKTLEKEIKEAEIKLNNLIVNSSSVVNKGVVKTIIAKTYEDIKRKTESVKLEELKNRTVIDNKVNFTNEGIGDSGKEDKEKREQEKKGEDKKEIKDIIIKMFKEGESIDRISEKTGFLKTEIELILKLENLI